MATTGDTVTDDRERVSILLVDDRPARLLSYETILSQLGQKLVRAGSGIEALQKLMREEFAVMKRHPVQGKQDSTDSGP